MAHFAKVDENNIVTDVIVVEPHILHLGFFGDPESYIQTSYNTRAGVHTLGGTPLRKNYAGIGYTYDPVRDAFYAPKPFPSWNLNEHSCVWEPPIPHPTNNIDGVDYGWDESTVSWVKIK